MDRVDTRDIAALLAAVDEQGNVDQVVFEAHRLILHNQHGGSLNSDGLMRAVHQSPLYSTSDRYRLIQTIDENLDTPLDRQRFSQSMDKSYLLNEAGHEIRLAYDAVKNRVVRGDQAASEDMATARQWAQGVANDPQRGMFMRGVGAGASTAVGTAQSEYGKAKGVLSDAASAITGVVDLGQMAWRLGTDENYRDALANLASTYANEIKNDPAKPVRDLYHSGQDALDTWQAGFAQAKAAGREQEYIGHAQGVAGMEILLAVVPASKAGKFGEVARILDHAPIRSTEQAIEVLAKASVLQHEGGDAAQGAEAIIRATVRDARVHGDLAMVLEAAKRTDTVNGLLRSGELTPRELGNVAKLDHTVFKSATSISGSDGVTFLEAMQASEKGADLSLLKSRQLGDIGEAIHTYDMVKEGYTDITAIKNHSGHGIDFVGRNQAGELEFHEVKTSAVGRAKTQRGDPEDFIESRLRKAIAAQRHWDPKNTLLGLNETALHLQNEIKESGGQIHAKWVQLNVSHRPGSPKLHVEKTIEEWTVGPRNTAHIDTVDQRVSPTIAQAQAPAIPGDIRDTHHPGHQSYGLALDAVHRMEDKHNLTSGPHSERLAAGLAVKAEGLRVSVDDVQIDSNGDQVTLIQHPKFNGRMPETTATISMDQALAFTVEQHSARWLQARSPHYTSTTHPERTREQAHTLSQLSPADQSIFAHIRARVPATVHDDAVTQATVAARVNRINKVEDIASAGIFDERLYVQGAQVGQFLATVDLSQPAPPLHTSVQQALAMDQQQIQHQQVAQQQQINQTGPQGPVMG
jgi:hypothetical protein